MQPPHRRRAISAKSRTMLFVASGLPSALDRADIETSLLLNGPNHCATVSAIRLGFHCKHRHHSQAHTEYCLLLDMVYNLRKHFMLVDDISITFTIENYWQAASECFGYCSRPCLGDNTVTGCHVFSHVIYKTLQRMISPSYIKKICS